MKSSKNPDNEVVSGSNIFRVQLAEEKIRHIPSGPRNPTGTGLRMDIVNEVIHVRADRFTTEGGTLTFFVDDQPTSAWGVGEWRKCRQVKEVRKNDNVVLLFDGATKRTA